ncbi:hypothetical protein L2E82_10156 [Cichorium intybus]|uniref:Uncharacterized protein n=1 Tax=Cichorium intybus TaxID=13427 RepID=A0ACB9GAW6_CICIN|nr:hypothetical protein L2E82_10156 [Cichorium intybus]
MAVSHPNPTTSFFFSPRSPPISVTTYHLQDRFSRKPPSHHLPSSHVHLHDHFFNHPPSTLLLKSITARHCCTCQFQLGNSNETGMDFLPVKLPRSQNSRGERGIENGRETYRVVKIAKKKMKQICMGLLNFFFFSFVSFDPSTQLQMNIPGSSWESITNLLLHVTTWQHSDGGGSDFNKPPRTGTKTLGTNKVEHRVISVKSPTCIAIGKFNLVIGEGSEIKRWKLMHQLYFIKARALKVIRFWNHFKVRLARFLIDCHSNLFKSIAINLENHLHIIDQWSTQEDQLSSTQHHSTYNSLKFQPNGHDIDSKQPGKRKKNVSDPDPESVITRSKKSIRLTINSLRNLKKGQVQEL